MTEQYTTLRNLFFAGLEEKTGWGRNQIKDLFDRCITEIGRGNAENSKIHEIGGDSLHFDVDQLLYTADENTPFDAPPGFDNEPPWD